MALGLPIVDIEFKQLGTTAIERGARGIVALILRDTVSLKKTVYDITDIPEGLSEANINYIKQALIGYTNAPLYIEICVLNDVETLVAALDYFEGVRFDYICFAEGEVQDQSDIATWIKGLRDNEGIMCKATVSNVEADYEGIINFTQDNISIGGVTYTSSQYLPRISGLICGTDLRISCTFAPLNEIDDIPSSKRNDINSKIANGELVLFKENGKVKIARGVTSLITTSQVKGDSFKKIKVVDIKDLMANDLRSTVRNSYIGKYGNSYDNKCLLIKAIYGYLDGLYLDGLIDANYSVGINIERQKAYLKSIGIDVNSMNEQEIKEANTKDKVFIEVKAIELDAMEEFYIDVIEGV